MFNEEINYNNCFDIGGDGMTYYEISFKSPHYYVNNSYSYTTYSEIAVTLGNYYPEIMFDGYSMHYDGAWGDQLNKIVDFGSEPQAVSKEFYEWLTANATKEIE